MRRWTRTVLVLFLSLLLGLPATAALAGGSNVRVVRPGESIQAAIDAASPGDTIIVKPGTYAEALVVQTDDLTLKGSKGTVLVMPDSADNICTELSGGTVIGICALGEINPETFEVIEYLEGPSISGFTIRGFSDSGIIALATDRFHAFHNRVEDNAGYGIFSISSTRPVLGHNKATGNNDAGLYVGGEQAVRAKVLANTSWDNGLGIFLRDASNGTATGNHVFGNCTGILLLANAPGPVTNWKLRHNLVRANNRDCGEEGPSGVGILLQGASDNEISRNVVVGNRGEAPSGGGIVLATAEPEEPGGEAIAPSGNVVRKNVVLRNRPFDISWDGTGTGNQFLDNLCRTSQPEGLCD